MQVTIPLGSLMIRRTRLLMRLSSAFAVLAVVQAMAVQPAMACERHHDGSAMEHASTASGSHETDCADHQGPPQSQHDPDCVANCLTMAGCSAPCFIGATMVSEVTLRQALPAPVSQQPHPNRTLPPDRPPPRA